MERNQQSAGQDVTIVWTGTGTFPPLHLFVQPIFTSSMEFQHLVGKSQSLASQLKDRKQWFMLAQAGQNERSHSGSYMRLMRCI